MQPHSNDSTNKSLCCGHYMKMSRTLHFWEHVFYYSLSSQCFSLWLCQFFLNSYLSKNEAVKLLFTLFNMFCYNII